MPSQSPAEVDGGLGLDGKRHGKGTSQRGQQEAAAVHAGWWGGWARQTGTLHAHPNSRISAFALSSQYVMPMSRYIVVAVARCSWACSGLSVRW